MSSSGWAPKLATHLCQVMKDNPSIKAILDEHGVKDVSCTVGLHSQA
ncbi:hypothetical protein [Dongshaea marina]|nr:hypothetical protein [Dongshaea marina]